MKRGRRPGQPRTLTCGHCGLREQTMRGWPYICEGCRVGGFSNLRARRCGRDYGGLMVRAAVAEGRLQPASAFMCSDCTKPAAVYDHRDYNRPLLVEPVCRSCNSRRGPGLPVYGWLHHAVRQGHRPYARRWAVAIVAKLAGVADEVIAPLPALLTHADWQRLIAHFPANAAEKAAA